MVGEFPARSFTHESIKALIRYGKLKRSIFATIQTANKIPLEK